jgi:cytochrome c oxidase subunit 2
MHIPRPKLAGRLSRTLAFGLFILCVSCAGGSGETGEDAIDLDSQGVHQIAPDRYVAVITSFEGGFAPTEIRVPVGAEVRFRVRSADVPHGLLIEGTDVALETDGFEWVEATHTFTEAGEYPFLCHIYCIGGHEAMRGLVIVE